MEWGWDIKMECLLAKFTFKNIPINFGIDTCTWIINLFCIVQRWIYVSAVQTLSFLVSVIIWINFCTLFHFLFSHYRSSLVLHSPLLSLFLYVLFFSLSYLNTPFLFLIFIFLFCLLLGIIFAYIATSWAGMEKHPVYASTWSLWVVSSCVLTSLSSAGRTCVSFVTDIRTDISACWFGLTIGSTLIIVDLPY